MPIIDTGKISTEITDKYSIVSSACVVGVSGAGANEFVVFRVGRRPDDASDTLTASAFLLGTRIDYTRT